MIVATDDDARAAGVFRWLGPAGWRFPKDHRGVSYAVAAGLAGLFVPIGAALVPTYVLPGGWVVDWLLRLLSVPVSLYVASRAARWVMGHVDLHRSVRWWLQTVRHEITAPRPPSQDCHVTVQFRPDLRAQEVPR